jgi:hypothetical protein
MTPDKEKPVLPAHPGTGRRWLLAIIIGVAAALYHLGRSLRRNFGGPED